MASVMIFDLLGSRVLVTRGSARAIGEALENALVEGQVELDFVGVEGMTPSFLDEALAVIEHELARAGGTLFRVLILNPPTRLSSKFAAVGRGRGLSISETPDGASWVISGEG